MTRVLEQDFERYVPENAIRIAKFGTKPGAAIVRGRDNMEITQAFLQAFLKKEKAERTIFEFSSAKKIDKALARFSHQADEILDPAKITRSGENISEKEVSDFFALPQNAKVWYYSPREKMWHSLGVTAAIERCFNESLCGWIFCEENRRAFLKEESEGSVPVKFLLCDKK